MSHYFHPTPRVDAVLQSVFFFLLIFVGSILVFFGKPFLFAVGNQDSAPAHLPSIQLDAIVLFALVAGGYELMRVSSLEIGWRIVLGSALGLSVSSITLLYEQSAMEFFLLLYLYIVTTGGVIMSPYFQLEMKPEFWKTVFESVLRLIRIILIGFAATVAALRIVGGRGGSSDDWFILTTAHSSIVLIFGLVTLGSYILVPTWKKMLESHAVVVEEPKKWTRR